MQPQLNETLAQVLGAIELASLRSADVLLKPNLIAAKNSLLSCTEGAFILAVARWLLERGARVSIGDSPAFGTAAMVLRSIGITEELVALGVQIKNFNQGRKVRLPGGSSAVLAEEALDCDLLVNLRVKAHAQARLTLAVKNYFGCLIGLRKPWWHMQHGGEQGKFFERVVQLPLVLPPSLSLLDGITAMHQSGPIWGQPYPLALVAASMNPVAIDTVLHVILGVSPEQSPLMAACRRAGLNGAELPQLSFPLMRPEDFSVSGFIVPETLNPVRFSLFRFFKSTVRRILVQKQNTQHSPPSALPEQRHRP
ncbi:MAG: Uncharacterized conserved protein, DUF362 family [Candidatus Electronema aureum]|uniref:Uncharacterized conserved protein, DUF362 family n=1 Tax=Candidatus Electronema aureum TaxID=2005002 RepID=A0A521FZ76_9BACT|nr:MAG: Uncharacterized conserved protein, DUF362 family [Candidatus Electronema aureum]